MLDESLLLAMLDERDLVSEYDAVRRELRQLAAHAVTEQATGFDPSGLGYWADVEGRVSDEWTTTTGKSLSTENATTVSDGSDCDGSKFTIRADATEADNVAELREIFPNFKDHTLSFVLKKSGGVIERAFDDLLTRQVLEETGELPKGVDGFYEPEDGKPKTTRRKDAKNRKGKLKLGLSYNVVSPTLVDEELEGAPGSPLPRQTPRSPAAASAVTPTRQRYSAAASLGHAMPDMEASQASRRSAAELARLGRFGRLGAVYYTERARVQADQSIAQASSKAEALVAGKSTFNKIDLHGVTVMDGVRIAKRRVGLWWNELGEGRQRIARVEGFTVITGVGNHSPNGVSRLKQAVGAALRNDGWKVQDQGGQFYITGQM